MSLQDYYSTRSDLISQDRARRRDNIRLASLTEAEKRADKVVRDIRAAEETSVWNSDHESIKNIFPGMEFLTGSPILSTSKEAIDATRLFKVMTKMPKGALLHAHLDATADKKFLWELALRHPILHVRATTPGPVSAANISSALPEFMPISEPQLSGALSLTDAGYSADKWIPLSQAREAFDPALGGPAGFDKWVLDSMVINPAEAYGTHNTVTKIWQKFVTTFRASTGLFLYRPIYNDYVRQFFLESIADGISYMEPRINFYTKFMFDASGEQNVPHREWLRDFDRIVKEIKEELKNEGREDEFFGAKIIYTTVRIITPEELQWYTEDCIALKQEFPHLIAGFDVVGDENVCRPLTDYIAPLLAFNARVAELGLDLPLLLHAGETLTDGGKADTNLYDALLLGTKRIGHGFSIVKHPKLMDMCREQGIALEVCPISNEILRLTSSMPMHPLPIMLNNGIPVALSSDDPAVFGSMGLSYDFFQVIVSSEVTGLITLGQMARDSLEFSTLPTSEKEEAIASWERRWHRFVEEVASLDPSA
ncbi:adenosine deaminase-like growth [Artomyces pyxidatus]|uniref:Adenosine deaminase-like growth n=1 Tax=Artomyces pyxidatus TaxID=48021 RepID=A0ACB8T3W4_9AGAM|nr:adenosine deaminase-like growth [Artomyces pyxidatus]